MAEGKPPPKKRTRSKLPPKKEPTVSKGGATNPLADDPGETFADYIVPDEYRETLWEVATKEVECEDPKLYRYARRWAVLFMRLRGHSYTEIANQLRCSVSQVNRLFTAGLKDHVFDEASTIIQKHVAHCEAMLAGLAERATEGDPGAVGASLMVMEKIEKMLGVKLAITDESFDEEESPADILTAKLDAISKRAAATAAKSRRKAGKAHAR